jgi:pPIWI RE three-gene island domain Z
MRDTRAWRAEPTKSLQRSDGLNKDQIEALLDIELGLFAIEKLGLQSEFLDSATGLWILISNRFFLFPALQQRIETSEAKCNLFNLRQLLHYLTNQDIVEQSLKTYRQIPSKYRAYEIDDGYRFTRKSILPTIWGNRFECFENLLSTKLKYRNRPLKLATPGKEYRFTERETAYSVRIPPDLPIYPGKPISLHGENLRSIKVTVAEMQVAARLLDDKTGGKYNYVRRLEDIIIERSKQMGFAPVTEIEFDGVKHLVGLLNAGKSTLIDILTVALVQKGHRIGVVFNEVVTCIRMANLLKQVGLRVCVAMGQRNRQSHLENWHGVAGDIEGFTHLSTACPLSNYIQPKPPASPPCFDLREYNNERVAGDSPSTEEGASKGGGVRGCPLIGQCPRHQDANQLADADVILTTISAAIFTRPSQHVSPQSITYYETIYRTCGVVFFDECDKIQANLDSTFFPAIKLIDRGSTGFLDRVVNWTRTQKFRNSRTDLQQVMFGKFNHALQNADALVDNIYTQLQISPNESEWLAKRFFTCSSLARDFVLDIAKAEGIDTQANTFILDKNPVYQELSEFLMGDWKRSWLAEYAMRLSHENYQEQQETLAKLEQDLVDRKWITSIKDRREFVMRFGLFLKLVLFVSFFQQAINSAYGVVEQTDGANDIALGNRIPQDFYGLVPGLATGLVCGFKLERRDELLTLSYFQILGQGRWLLENFSHVFAGEGTRGAHALLLSGTSWAGASPTYHVDLPVDYLLRPKQSTAIKVLAQSSFHFSPCYWGDGKPVRVSGVESKEESLVQILKSLLQQTDILQRDFDALPGSRKRLIWYVNSYEQVEFLRDAILTMDTGRQWRDRIATLTRSSPLEDLDASLITRSNIENFANTNRSILIAPIAAIGRGKNILNDAGLSAFGGAYFLVRPHPAPDDLDYKFQIALRQERIAILAERSGNLIDACESWRREGYQIFLRSLEKDLRYSDLSLPKHVRAGLIWTQMVLTWQAIARTIRGNQPTLVRFIDAAWAPNLAEHKPETEHASLLKGFKHVLHPYFAKTRTAFDGRDIALVRSLYEPFYRALEKIDGL